MCALPLSDPEAQTDGFVCPICAQPLDLRSPNTCGKPWATTMPSDTSGTICCRVDWSLGSISRCRTARL